MELFIDTADVKEIESAQAMGLLDGVTTNPTLVAKTGRPHREVLEEICELVSGPVSAEVHAVVYDEMMREARELATIAPNIVVKIPLIEEGIRAVRSLSDEGIKTNVTLCFSPLQGMLAAKAGATYISPFVGRLDDIGHDGMALVEQLVDMYERYDFETKVLVASVRSPSHVVEALRLGADVATIPFGVIAKLIHHPLTDAGLARFLEDAKAIPKT
ncbi:fructose-6-phosphate aldolase [Pseudenhygromyxa sp. WMMC2535]|uniref:fructose-6-phosphate aldolase n=1 Tax=Pseudenhygromyxa sp. WMMC2535 TaxID=2712867 RepID=UPI0015559F2B|nr:fructose-6-phosphate aldolase [Pseudenhygromyxa sp. WMMC2535]NVB37972.1 fructose-6-phosphate aldolase [Pseudenhygromyxa sp. WMMC2535]